MPVYEHECPVCNNSDSTALKLEVRQGYNDKALVRCPKCRSICKRLISNVPHYWKDGVPD